MFGSLLVLFLVRRWVLMRRAGACIEPPEPGSMGGTDHSGSGELGPRSTATGIQWGPKPFGSAADPAPTAGSALRECGNFGVDGAGRLRSAPDAGSYPAISRPTWVSLTTTACCPSLSKLTRKAKRSQRV